VAAGATLRGRAELVVLVYFIGVFAVGLIEKTTPREVDGLFSAIEALGETDFGGEP
jgi:hypothetical protein